MSVNAYCLFVTFLKKIELLALSSLLFVSPSILFYVLVRERGFCVWRALNTCFENRDQSRGKAQQKPSRAVDHRQSQIFGYGVSGRCIEEIFSSLPPRWGFLQLSECIWGFWGMSPGRWQGELISDCSMAVLWQVAHHYCWNSPPKLLNLWYGILSVYPTVGLCQQRFTSLPSVGTREAMIGYCRQ